MSRSTDEERLLSLVPADGSIINNRILREQLGWPDEKYEQAREKLVEKGLILRGPGQGGTVRRADAEHASDDEEPEETLPKAIPVHVKDEEKLLALLPQDGASKGNRSLCEQLGWREEKYEAVRDQLVEKGLVVRGPGPGGTVRLTEGEERALLSQVPADGSAISSTRLVEVLGWPEGRYVQVRDRLIEKGLLTVPPGRGRGTSVCRPGAAKPPAVAVATPKPPAVVAATPKPPAVAVATPKPRAVAVATPKLPAVVAATPKPPAVAAATPKPPAAYDARRHRDEGPVLEKPIKIFIAYVQSDEPLKKELLEYLHMLEKEQWIEIWHDQMITPGEDWRDVLNQQLREAEIILFLVSTVFLNSSYCNGDEMKTALARHDSGEAIVIPVILRPCMWHLNRLLSKLRALPKSDLPVTKWPDRDDALTNIAQGIYDAVQKLIQKR